MVSETQLMQMAGQLSDLGFGEFEVCLDMLVQKKGNASRAKKALSREMFR